MKNLWNDKEAARYNSDLELRVYTSRLLGRDTTLVLHGGGNTSVKIREKNILGEEEDILYVKGSGWDLETIEAAGFAPVRLQHLIKLSKLPSLSDTQMVNELRTHMTLASAPTPSVEAILHATLPFKYVDHTHADSVVAVTNNSKGLQRIKEIYGDSMVIIPYVMPGFDLARLCAEQFEAQAHEGTVGMILMNHGIFSFAETAKQSYDRMIELVSKAESYLKKNNAWVINVDTNNNTNTGKRHDICTLRNSISAAAGFPMILNTRRDDSSMSYIQHSQLPVMSQQGPATPDHVIRTKRLPLLGRDVDAYSNAYHDYFKTIASESSNDITILDQAPRVVLDKELGLCSLGKNIKDALIVSDIYQHTIEIIQRAEKLGGYQALPAKDIFDVEYWELEQAKLKKSGSSPAFSGEIALVTGAASGIGQACVKSLLKRGAAVIGLDIDKNIEAMIDSPAFLGLCCDVTNDQQLTNSLETGVSTFGGIDMLILNAGTFPPGCRIESLSNKEWRRVMNINLDSNLSLMRECFPLLKLAPSGGRIVMIGSKNVPAPGPGAAAYSSSKAALNQLARVAALEWGGDNIRINTLHPDAVFDTGLWTEEVLQTRAQHYNMSVHDYKTKNILKTEVCSEDVAELAAEMCGDLFAKTTGAQLPVDGGNDRVI